MKPRNFLNFFKTKSGKLAAFGAVFAAGLVIFSVLRKQTTNDNGIKIAPLSTNITGKPQVVQSVQRPLVVFRPPPPMSSSMAQSNSSIVTHSASSASLPLPQPRASSRQTETLAPISLFADSAAGVARPKKLSAIYAPFGRLIPCETIITVDSSSMETPIVGLITENVYYGDKLIIPAGTEVHGMAQTDRQRD
ncbi:MAG: hypothetical protein ACREFE_16185, partial [Limisphaerales bacterium]